MIYVLHDEQNRLFKIGFSSERCVERRVKGLIAGYPFYLMLIGTFEGTRATESFIHRALYKTRVRRTEWFTASPILSRLVADLRNGDPPELLERMMDGST